MTLSLNWVRSIERLDNGWLVRWRNSETYGRAYLTCNQLLLLVVDREVKTS